MADIARGQLVNRVAGAVLALVVALALVVYVLRPETGKLVTAYFSQAVGVYGGSDVRVLGVRVGRIESVRPAGREVKVTLRLDDDVEIPAGANAVVVAPSVVADRYVQLAPVYTGGPQIADGTVIPASRTATPVEVDQLYESITKLTDSLGPDGVNSTGALSEALKTGEANLRDNGEAIGDMIREFGQATRTLSGTSDEFFGTLSSLQKFTTMLKANDSQVSRAEQQLAEVNEFLAADRDELAAALSELATALREVERFIREHRPLLRRNVDRLAKITQVLVDQRASLAEVLDVAPLAAGNVLNAYDPVSRSLMGRGNLNEISMGPGVGGTSTARPVGSQLCGTADEDSALAELCDKYRLGPRDLVPLPDDEQSVLPPMPLPPVGDVYGPAAKEEGR
ncbi:virulence factor Mce family protein [Thermomonospora echinospora]|uniref:Virulence factor Mce family protein n=1 Tax=Thermomonospora echinospora TaxID=1992 RepID=A0A1H5Y1D6_9ACTN|nr:MCE family protein [Thermomonospora echinospora]SEG17672.1 virulence factor Mce family protein [Thermomonospora echinospora]